MKKSHWVMSLIILAGTAIVAGCSPERRVLQDANEVPSLWRSDLLYLHPEPCSRVFVEVDYVEGSAPGDEMLNAIRDFLYEHCRKPVEVRVSHPIPVLDAKGKHFGRIALENIDGPPDDGPGAAFVYVLFYDGSALGLSPFNWHTDVLYPCAVYVDLSYQRKLYTAYFGPEGIQHELGHVLGLCRNPAHWEKGPHCSNRQCRMYYCIEPPLRTRLFALPPPQRTRSLCQACLNDLEVARRTQPPANIEFRGPFLVRREADYCVIACPYLTLLAPGSDPESLRDWHELLGEAKKRATEMNDPRGSFRGAICTPSQTPEAAEQALQKATNDVSFAVRQIAERGLASMHSQPAHSDSPSSQPSE